MSLEERGNSDLENRINTLKEGAEVLNRGLIINPLMAVIEDILGLPKDMRGLSDREISDVQRRVQECERILKDFGILDIERLINNPEKSKVFKILSESEKFRQELKRFIGQKISLEGEEITLTEGLYEILTEPSFSIGTPPITPKGIETIQNILFGNNLQSIYQFRELLGEKDEVKFLFDDLIRIVDKTINQSTHYTTSGEKREFEDGATDYNNMEGLKGFTKSIVSGSSQTAIRLIKEKVFGRYKGKEGEESPVEEIAEPDCLNEGLIARMKAQKKTIFIVRITKAPKGLFLKEGKLDEEWYGILGRLILVDDSDEARKGTTIVYSLNPKIKETLDTAHIKDSGTLANTQMNFRTMLQRFSTEDLGILEQAVLKKIEEYEEDGVHKMGADEVRKKGWLLEAQKDYLSLKRFIEFSSFIKEIKNATDEELLELNRKMLEETEQKAMDYFFKGLKGKGYSINAVPQGGGRRELGHVGDFFTRKFTKKLKSFSLEESKRKLEELKTKAGISTTQTEYDAKMMAEIQDDTALGSIRNMESPNRWINYLKGKLMILRDKGVEGAEAYLERLDELSIKLTSSNLIGIIKGEISGLFKRVKKGGAAKLMDRGIFQNMTSLFTEIAGFLRKNQRILINMAREGMIDPLNESRTAEDLSFAERLINDIENKKLKPNLALNEMGWTFDDVLDEDDFPKENYIKIKVKENGEIDTQSLELQLRDTKRKLKDFPELFELYCSSTLLIVNDPHNPSAKVATSETKRKLLEIASEYGLTILSDEAYRKQVNKDIKDREGDCGLAEFYEKNKTRFSKPIIIYTTLPTTKWAMGAGRRTGVVVSNDKEEVDNQTFSDFVKTRTDGVNILSVRMDNETYDIGLKTKSICEKLEPLLVYPFRDNWNPEKVIENILKTEFPSFEEKDFCPALYFALLEARNELDFLSICEVSENEIKNYINELVSNIKNFRLDKQTQRDSEKRSKVVSDAIERVAEEHPFLRTTAIKPEGPFYTCVKLDNSEGENTSLLPFLLAIAKARNIAVVPAEKGYVRFAFGGELEGSDESYELLGLKVETDLKILIKYWEKFKLKKASLEEQQDINPEANALKDLFPGVEQNLVKIIQEKSEYIKRKLNSEKRKKKQLVQDIPANVKEYLSEIEPGVGDIIITLKEIKCETLKEFINSEPFRDLFNYFLIKIKSKIPAIQHLDNEQLINFYGARRFAEKEGTRSFKDNEKEVFGIIAKEIAKIWFSDKTRKILASAEEDSSSRGLLGAEAQLTRHIKAFLDVFMSPDEQRDLIKSFRDVPLQVKKYLPVEEKYPATFQAGYRVEKKLQPSRLLPKWLKNIIGKGEFATNSTATDPSPAISTSGKRRAPGVDRAILKRDGDGEEKPKAEFFSKRLERFSEVMNSGDYVFKMVPVGGIRTLLIMNRSYSHYIADELRLFPQQDFSLEDLGNCNPEAVSFLGLPTKVMGEEYRVGYFFDKKKGGEKKGGESLPVSWVNAESITDYVGYLKKPILTVANEKALEKGMMPVHGSAFSIIFKNGLRKTMVLGGDSGTGKSETIIAMMKQIINNKGLAKKVEGIEFLSGDMLTLFEGNDNQAYMLGTEQGDFMRMTEIPEDWEQRVRDRINLGSKTNLTDKHNPRISIGNLCNPNEFLKPVRVNCFFNINNYETPEKSAVRITETPKNLLLEEFVDGFRSEQGTSGDQPNIYGSVLNTEVEGEKDLINRFGKQMDKLLGWDIVTDEELKAVNAYLSFNLINKIPGGVQFADLIVDKLFKGKSLGDKKIIKTLRRRKNYYLIVRGDDGQEKEIILDRENVFKKIYNLIAATYCGNKFVSSDMGATLKRFAEIMGRAGVKTGTLFTQLGIKGMAEEGPGKASQDLLKFLLEDEDINTRFETHKEIVKDNLHEKYGDLVRRSPSIPDDIMTQNLYLWEKWESDNIYPINSEGKAIPLETKYYKANVNTERKPLFNSSLIPVEIHKHISDVCENKEHARVFRESSFEVNIEEYSKIKSWDNKEELIYQILIIDGEAQLSHNEIQFGSIKPINIKKAEAIAKTIMSKR